MNSFADLSSEEIKNEIDYKLLSFHEERHLNTKIKGWISFQNKEWSFKVNNSEQQLLNTYYVQGTVLSH